MNEQVSKVREDILTMLQSKEAASQGEKEKEIENEIDEVFSRYEHEINDLLQIEKI